MKWFRFGREQSSKYIKRKKIIGLRAMKCKQIAKTKNYLAFGRLNCKGTVANRLVQISIYVDDLAIMARDQKSLPERNI